MRISKGACWVGLVVSTSCWVGGCGDSSTDAGGAAGAAAQTSSAGNSDASTGGASAHAGSSHTPNGGRAGALNGSAGAPSTAGVPGTAGAPNTAGGSGTGGAAHGTAGAPGTAGAAHGTAGAHAGGASGTAGSASGGSSGAVSGNAGAGGAGATVKSAGCGKAAPLSAPTQQTVMIDTAARGYFLVPPTAYDKNKPYALIFAFHGSGNTGAGFRSADFEAGAAGQAIWVYPDGVGGVWDLKNNGSDAKLFDSIVATMSSNWCIDTGAVFAVGFSYGGWAATQMASARPTVVRAIASIEGGGPQGASNSDPPVAAMIIHGKNDTAEPISSGMSSRDHFVKINGCASTTSAATPAPCVAYDGCKPKKSVYWCAHDGAHEIPSFTPQGMWAFFNSTR